MKPLAFSFVLAVAIAVIPIGVSSASILEVGDLNIINQTGNASDGLRFLDMSYSDGLSMSAALANAQATYSNARLATASEFNDLFQAADINYNGILTASDGFTTGPNSTISSASNYDGGTLSGLLGYTDSNSQTLIWTDPDASNSVGTTRDFLFLDNNVASIFQSTTPTPHLDIGWLIVSEASAVPEPTSLLCWLGLGFVGLTRRRRNQ